MMWVKDPKTGEMVPYDYLDSFLELRNYKTSAILDIEKRLQVLR